MIYLTKQRLMLESETTIHERAASGDLTVGQVCRQLVKQPDFYSLWRSRHDKRMVTVAERARRDRQILALRSFHLQQIHRSALVRYLREHMVTGADRDLTLQEFYGVMDTRRAALAEHKTYLISASSQLCTNRLLDLVGDHRGLKLLQDYQGIYNEYFAMFCDNARAARRDSAYLLHGLIPDAKAEAEAVRERILGGHGLPSGQFAIKHYGS